MLSFYQRAVRSVTSSLREHEYFIKVLFLCVLSEYKFQAYIVRGVFFFFKCRVEKVTRILIPPHSLKFQNIFDII